MTKYDTQAQRKVRAGRRRLNLAVGVVLVALGAYILGSYLVAFYSPYPQPTSFGALLGIFLFCASLIPFSQAFVRRPHPDSLEVRDDALVLRFGDGKILRYAWEAKPVEFAYDSRTAPYGKRAYEGMEVQLYIPEEGREPGSRAFRPQEVDVSGPAFDEVKKAMERAGWRAVSRRWSRSRPGDLVEFLGMGETEGPLPPEIKGGWGRRAREVPLPASSDGK